MVDGPFPIDGETAVRPDLPSTPVPSRFAPGTLITDRFRIVAQLGHGGMGEVFRADDLKLGQSVALKFLPRDVVHDRTRLEHLHAEVRIGRQVSHPNVCRLYDIFEWQGTHFIAMEYVDGEDLASLLRRIGRLQSDKALDIARDLSAGLAAAHDLGVVHRDLKPANVMVDGRGRARITDFGLAVLATEGGGFAGTPAYMSPEQLRGEKATPRSDLYSLGLILFEIFTGRQAFEGTTLEEIKRKRASTKTPSVSSVVRDIDPIVERVIGRCLENDPAARPTSAHAVIASLPGGDPLAAAVAAGETPSPEMVAAAGETGELRPLVAWSIFAGAVVAILTIALMSSRSMVYRLVSLPKSTEVLQARALEIADRFGHAVPADVGGEWNLDDDFIAYQRHNRRTVRDWNTRPGVVRYVARLSPKAMRAWNAEARIMAFDPPLLDPGMTRVQLDPAGHLIEFASVPADKIATFTAGVVDWNALFIEAGLDPKRFRPVRSLWSAPVDSDAKVAWDGTLASAPEVPLHVEAASRAAAPVWFKIFGPWDQPRSPVESRDLGRTIGETANLLLEVVPVVAGIFLAIANLRRRRGDRRGALRVAAFCFLTAGIANVFRADHGGFDFDEWRAIQISLGQALFIAATAWLLYVALEPYVRRKWPRLLISWTRLVSGRWRDPMVGRDVLIGALGGLGLILLMHATRIVPEWFDIENAAPMVLATSPFASAKHVVYLLLFVASMFTLASIELIALMVFLRLALRRRSFAAVALFLMLAFAFSGAIRNGDGRVVVAYSVLSAAILTLVTMRYGLLALATCGYFWGVLTFTTLTIDSSAWYFGRSLLVMLVLIGIVLWAGIIAIGDKSLFGVPMFDEA